MDEHVFKCSSCEQVMAPLEIPNHECNNVKTEIKSEPEDEAVIEYLESESDMEVDKGIISEAGEEALWTHKDTKHLLHVYKEALPLICGDEGNFIDVWQTILANMDENVAKKYSATQVRQRINFIFSHKASKAPDTLHLLPLIDEIKELEKTYKAEFENSDVMNSEEDNSMPETGLLDGLGEYCDSDTLQWTGKEIVQIINIYKKYIKILVATISNKEKRKVWDKIASEMVMFGNRECTAYAARTKIMNLKKTWVKHKRASGPSTWIYFKLMSEVMKEEEKAKAEMCGVKDPSSSSEVEQEEPRPKRKRKSEEPAWFSKYMSDAAKRHEEKMKLKFKLLSLLELFAERINE